MTSPIRIPGEQITEGTTRRQVIETYPIANLKKGDTTPVIKNVERWRCVNTAFVTITDFLHGADWQNLYLLGDGNTTLQNNANIILLGAADKLLSVNTITHLQHVDGIWIEVG